MEKNLFSLMELSELESLEVLGGLGNVGNDPNDSYFGCIVFQPCTFTKCTQATCGLIDKNCQGDLSCV